MAGLGRVVLRLCYCNLAQLALVALSKKERKFLQDLRKGDLSSYLSVYRHQLYNILKKRKGLTEDLLLVNDLLDKLQEL